MTTGNGGKKVVENRARIRALVVVHSVECDSGVLTPLPPVARLYILFSLCGFFFLCTTGNTRACNFGSKCRIAVVYKSTFILFIFYFLVKKGEGERERCGGDVWIVRLYRDV